MRKNLLTWQWADYAMFHQSIGNRVLHLIGVPLFVLGALAIPAGLIVGEPMAAAAGPAAMAIGFGLQAFGHKRLEPVAPIPFDGPADALSRIVAEQFVTFFRYAASGFTGRR